MVADLKQSLDEKQNEIELLQNKMYGIEQWHNSFVETSVGNEEALMLQLKDLQEKQRYKCNSSEKEIQTDTAKAVDTSTMTTKQETMNQSQQTDNSVIIATKISEMTCPSNSSKAIQCVPSVN